jgi:hypothetical protein
MTTEDDNIATFLTKVLVVTDDLVKVEVWMDNPAFRSGGPAPRYKIWGRSPVWLPKGPPAVWQYPAEELKEHLLTKVTLPLDVLNAARST